MLRCVNNKPLTAEEALARLRNRDDSGLPPSLEQFLNEQCRDDAERALFLQVMEDLLRDKARQEFAERYPDDLDDEDVSVEEMERLIAEMRQRKQQQAGN